MAHSRINLWTRIAAIVAAAALALAFGAGGRITPGWADSAMTAYLQMGGDPADLCGGATTPHGPSDCAFCRLLDATPHSGPLCVPATRLQANTESPPAATDPDRPGWLHAAWSPRGPPLRTL